MQMTNRAWAEMALLGLIWGGSFVTVAVALQEMGPFAVVLWRTGLGALALWLAAAALRAPLPRDPAFWGACAVMGVLNNVIPFTLMAWGQQSIESGLASILNAATAVFGALAAAALLRDERLTRRRAAGVLLGVAGVVAITGPEALTGLDPRSLGQLAVLGGALSYAFASVWARVRLTGGAVVAVSAGSTTAAFLTMIPLTLWAEGPPPLPASPQVWGAVAYYGVLGTGAAYLLYGRLIQRSSAANATLVTLVIPPIAILLGAALLDETLPAHAYLGLALIAAGLAVLDGRVLSRLRGRRAAADAGPPPR